MKTHPKGSFVTRLLPIGRWLWRRIPPAVLASRPMRRLNREIYDRCVKHTKRDQTHFTWFVRNPPQLALVADLIFSAHPSGPILRVMSVGCSVGAELYSLLWLIRRVQPDIAINARGVDIVPEAVASARHATYRIEAPSSCGGTLCVAGRNVLSTSTQAIGEIFDVCPSGAYRVKDAIRAGTTWHVGNATDPALLDAHGLQDVVLACNFLGPMETEMAERCLRNIAALVVPGGYLVVDGVDLDVKARTLKSLGLLPITEDVQCIHEADPTKRDWPWTRWSLEPFDDSRADWPYRYVTIFQRPMLLERSPQACRSVIATLKFELPDPVS